MNERSNPLFCRAITINLKFGAICKRSKTRTKLSVVCMAKERKKKKNKPKRKEVPTRDGKRSEIILDIIPSVISKEFLSGCRRF